MITPVINSSPRYQNVSRCGACNAWPGEKEKCEPGFPKNQVVTRNMLACDNYVLINMMEKED